MSLRAGKAGAAASIRCHPRLSWKAQVAMAITMIHGQIEKPLSRNRTTAAMTCTIASKAARRLYCCSFCVISAMHM